MAQTGLDACAPALTIVIARHAAEAHEITRSRRRGACAAGSAMRVVAASMATMIVLGMLSGCTTALLGREDRAQVCRVAVVVPSEPYAPPPRESMFANPAGGAMGLWLGVLALLSGNPVGALHLAEKGAQCAAGSVSHPNAHADFQAIYRSASAQSLAQGIERELEALRGGRALTEASLGPKPDTIVEVASIVVGLDCACENWKYGIAVTWRVKRADGGGIMAETTTRCQHATNRNVDDWFAHPEDGRSEFEQVLGLIGKRIAAELTADRKSKGCVASRLKSGEIVLE